MLHTLLRSIAYVFSVVAILIIGCLFAFQLAIWDFGWLAFLCFGATFMAAFGVLMHGIHHA